MKNKSSKSSGGGGKKKKSKRQNISGPKAVAMKLKAPPPNPFETIWSRRKFDILGKKRKGEELRVGLARSNAIEKRKKTLLKEYEQSGKSSVFLDKRIGEQNDDLGEFDKAIMRSQRERQMRVSKKQKYNLSDGEEDDFGDEGLGAFPERDDFTEDVPLDDDEDAGPGYNGKSLPLSDRINDKEGSAAEGEENRRKTKKEVMEELIRKSKYFKAQKAKDKEENDELTNQLDKDFMSLGQSNALLSLTQPNKMTALKALVNKSISSESVKKDGVVFGQNKDLLHEDKPDSYDMLVKEMSLDMRARPSDRTKTPEEIAQEEKERLEELEEERQKRMLAADESSDEDGEDTEDAATTDRPRSLSGDDLGDSFSHDEERRTKGAWIRQALKGEKSIGDRCEDGSTSEDLGSGEDDSDDEMDSGSEEDEKAQSLKDWEQSDDENLNTDLEDEEEDSEEEEDDNRPEKPEQKIHKKAPKVKEIAKVLSDAGKTEADRKPLSSQQGELPYVIAAPKSLEELSELLQNRPNSQIIEAIRRIRTCNAISIAAENRKKMQVFYGVLLQYFAVSANERPLNLELLNLLVKPLVEISGEIPYFAAICARQRLFRIRTQFCEDIKNPEKSCWPTQKTLFLFRLWSLIFPCSDFRHAVMTPVILLMCEFLMRCPITSGRDIAVGSFLCSMVLSVTRQSNKFCPEAIIFLQTLLTTARDKKPGTFQDSQLSHLMELKALRPYLCLQSCVKEINPLDFVKLIGMPDDSAFFSSDHFRASILASTIDTLQGFISLYEGFSSFSEIFLPISKLLLEVAEQENLPHALRDKIKDASQHIEQKDQEQRTVRRPLQMLKQKPVPIKLLNPNFEDNFVKGRDYDPDRERVETKKLKKLVKQEAKGAIRELRKDNYFLFEVKEKDKARLEEERAEKYGKARAFLQEQEHAFKSGQLGKGKGKKRRR